MAFLEKKRAGTFYTHNSNRPPSITCLLTTPGTQMRRHERSLLLRPAARDPSTPVVRASRRAARNKGTKLLRFYGFVLRSPRRDETRS